jgi:uncharacterized lipoprotein YmbA
MMRACVLLSSTLMLAACASEPVPADRYYRIEAPRPAAAAPISAIVGVDPVRAGGIYSERALLYLRNGALEQRRFDFWAESPDNMIEQALLAYLRAAFGAEHVVTGGARVHADLNVRTRIERLEELAEDGPPKIAAQFQFAISDAQGRTLKVLESGGVREIAGTAPSEFVHGLEAQAGVSFAELEAQLRALARTEH